MMEFQSSETFVLFSLQIRLPDP